MDMSVYPHLKDKNDIRLLNLEPSGKPIAKIRCTTEAVGLHTDLLYEAISWEWGDPTKTEVIFIDDQPCNIPKNLARALRQYRQTTTPRLLWADAVCINQADLEERSRQISLMGQIYGNAKRVLVWLGPTASKKDLKVFPLLENLASGMSMRQIFHHHVTGEALYKKSADQFRNEYGNGEFSSRGHELIDQLSSLFEIGWWDRLWVLQEVVLAQEVELQWGKTAISLAIVLEAQRLLEEDMRHSFYQTAEVFGLGGLRNYLTLSQTHMDPIKYFRAQYTELRKIDWRSKEQKLYAIAAQVLATNRYRHTSDSRDGVYGLLGMLPSIVAERVQPSYSASASSVSYDIACQILQSTKSFMLFNCIVPEADHNSWYPNWGCRRAHHEDFSLRVSQQHLFSACGDVEWQLSIQSDGVLRTKGVRIDQIKQLYSARPRDQYDVFDTYNVLRTWFSDIRDQYAESSQPLFEPKDPDAVPTLRYPDGSDLDEAIYRTVLNDCIPLNEDGQLCRAHMQDWLDFEKCFKYLSSLQEPDFASREHSLSSYPEQLRFSHGCKGRILQAFHRCIRGRELFLTEIGYIGIIRDEFVEIGDEVWILAGGSHPVVLRPVAGCEASHQAVADVYMHGVMDGEVIHGECPVLPSDGDAAQIQHGCDDGRKTWPTPRWTEVRIK